MVLNYMSSIRWILGFLFGFGESVCVWQMTWRWKEFKKKKVLG